MGLFAQEPGAAAGPAPAYTGWTREIGTRKLIFWFIAVVVCWYGFGRMQDHFLLQAKWPALTPQPDGLTVIGTLDSRDYDRNMYRVVTSNQTSRIELTDYGWNTIFDDKNGPLFNPSVGDIIKQVSKTDSDNGSRMLEPYLRAGVAHEMGSTDWAKYVSRSTPITIDVGSGKMYVPQATTLGELVDKYSHRGGKSDEQPDAPSDVGEGDSGHSVEHGMPIPADSLIVSSPVVLVGSNFTGADLDEHPASMFDSATYMVTLNLSPEGRSRFFQWSSGHESENLIFIINHSIVAAGRIKQRMNVSSWNIGPLHDAASAKALVDYVNGLKR